MPSWTNLFFFFVNNIMAQGMIERIEEDKKRELFHVQFGISTLDWTRIRLCVAAKDLTSRDITTCTALKLCI